MNATAPTPPAEGTSPTFRCPNCRLEHPWAQAYVGKTARCGCGHVLKVPAGIGAPPALRPAPREESSPTPSNDSAPGLSGFLRAPSGFASPDDVLPSEVEAELAATAKYGEEDFTRPDPRRDLHVPVALLAMGFLITVIDFGYGMRVHPGAAVAAGILVAGVKLVFGMILMLGAALLAARFAGINFGPIGPALLKLAGLCLAPSALGDLTTQLLGGDMAVAQIGWVVRVVLYWALVSYLFRLDGGQTAAVVGAITVLKIVSTVVIGSLLAFAFAPAVDEAFMDPGNDESATRVFEGALEDAGGDTEEE